MNIRGAVQTAVIRSREAATLPTVILIASVGALMTGALAFRMFRRTTTPWTTLPDNDYWHNIRGLITEGGVSLNPSVLFSYNNEHIVVVPKLIYAANYLLTSGSNVGLIAYSLVIAAACVGILLFMARDMLWDRPWRFLICALLFPLVMFSPKLAHNYFLGMSGAAWLTADLFVILSAVSLSQAVQTQKSIWLLVSLLNAAFAVLTYTTGIYAVISLVVILFALAMMPRWRGALPMAGVLGTALLACIVLVGLAVSQIYRQPHEGEAALSFHLLSLTKFTFVYLGSAITAGPWRVLAGVLILLGGGFCIGRLVVQGRAVANLAWIQLFLFAPFAAVLTGVARATLGMGVAESSRYQSVAAVSLIATIALCLYALPRPDARRSTVVWAGLVAALSLLCVGIIESRSVTLAPLVRHNERKAVAEIALRQGLYSNQHLAASTPAIGQLAALLPALRSAGHVPFDSATACEAMIGRQVDEAALFAWSGALDRVSAYEVAGGGQALELSGWALHRGAAPECIVIVDGSRTAIGAGVPVGRRPDVERKKRRALGLVGWKAVARIPNAGLVCALALFRNSRILLPLSTCKTIAAATRPDPT